MSTKNKKNKKKRSTVTASRFFDPLVLVLGEKTGFKADKAVPMAEVVEEVLTRSDLTDKEREENDEKFLHRRVGFAFRNRRAKYVADSNIEALTVLVDGKGGQWGLTKAGVTKARELSVDDILPPEPADGEEDLPPESEDAVSEEDTELPEEVAAEVEEKVAQAEADIEEKKAAKPKPKPKKKTAPRKRGPRTLSEISAN